MTTKLLDRLDQFWFVPTPASRPAVLRILIGAFSLYLLGSAYFDFPARVAGSPDLYVPVGLAVLLPEPLPASVFQVVVLATMLANVAFLVGWRYGTTGPLFGVLMVFVLCYRNSWGMVYHTDNLLALHALVLGFSRAADVFSVDALTRSTATPPAVPYRDGRVSWQYGWPIRLLCAVTVTTYFLAGVAKIASPLGWSWASADSLRTQIAFDGLRKEFLAAGPPQLSFALAEWDIVFLAMGVMTLVVELGAPAALVSRRAAALWVAGSLMMHWGIYFIMGIEFRYAMLGLPFASFLALARLPRTTEIDNTAHFRGSPNVSPATLGPSNAASRSRSTSLSRRKVRVSGSRSY